MKLKLKIALIIISFVLILFSILLIYLDISHIEKKVFEAYVIIGDKVGFELNGTALAFGMIMPGGSAAKSLIVENSYHKPIYIQASAIGSIKPFFNEHSEIVQPYEKKDIQLSVSANKTAEKGRYAGEVIVTIIRKF